MDIYGKSLTEPGRETQVRGIPWGCRGMGGGGQQNNYNNNKQWFRSGFREKLTTQSRSSQSEGYSSKWLIWLSDQEVPIVSQSSSVSSLHTFPPAILSFFLSTFFLGMIFLCFAAMSSITAADGASATTNKQTNKKNQNKQTNITCSTWVLLISDPEMVTSFYLWISFFKIGHYVIITFDLVQCPRFSAIMVLVVLRIRDGPLLWLWLGLLTRAFD